MWLRVREYLDVNGGLLLLFVVLSASLTVNVILGWKVRQISAQRQTPRPSGVREEITLPLVHALDENGARVLVSFSEARPSVVYVISPSCSWCKRNQPNITALASAKHGQFRFIGLSIAGDRLKLKDYLLTNPLPFQVFLVDSPTLVRQLGFDVTPQTIVVSPAGRVERVWVGALEGTLQNEVERYFGVKLPGLKTTTLARRP